jgi:hypothetical protein
VLWSRVCLIRVCLDRIYLGRVYLVFIYLTGVGLAGVRLAGFLPDDVGILGAGAGFIARPDLSGVIAGVLREAAGGRIAVLGRIPGAAQFGHASVCPQRRSANCG